METSTPVAPAYPLFEPVPETEIQSRLGRLQAVMAQQGPEAALFTHRPDVYYLSGTAQDCYVFVRCGFDPILLVKREMARARSETFVPTVLPLYSVKDIPETVRDVHGSLPGELGLAFDVVPVRDYLFFQKLFKPARITDAAFVVSACRQVKSQWEIERMTEAARLSRQTFEFAVQHLAPGESEMAFCGRVEAFARTMGHSGRLQMRGYRAEGYSHHLLSGWAGGLPGGLDSPASGTGTCNAYPFGAGPKKIRANEPILMDLGTMVNGYHIDETRMLALGNMPGPAEKAGLAALDILEHVKDFMKPAVRCADVFETAVRRANQLGLGHGFLGLPDLKSRFIGHGVGLELVEAPMLAKGRTDLLEPGMVMAVEPKFIFEGRFAAGVESVILITETGSRFLSLTGNRMFVI